MKVKINLVIIFGNGLARTVSLCADKELKAKGKMTASLSLQAERDLSF